MKSAASLDNEAFEILCMSEVHSWGENFSFLSAKPDKEPKSDSLHYLQEWSH